MHGDERTPLPNKPKNPGTPGAELGGDLSSAKESPLFLWIRSFYENHKPQKNPNRNILNIPAAFLLGIFQGIGLSVGDFFAFPYLMTRYGAVNPFNFIRSKLGTGILGTFLGGVTALVTGSIALAVGLTVGTAHAVFHGIASPFIAAYYAIKGYGVKNALGNNAWFTAASLMNTLIAIIAPIHNLISKIGSNQPRTEVQFFPANLDTFMGRVSPVVQSERAQRENEMSSLRARRDTTVPVPPKVPAPSVEERFADKLEQLQHGTESSSDQSGERSREKDIHVPKRDVGIQLPGLERQRDQRQRGPGQRDKEKPEPSKKDPTRPPIKPT